MFGWDPALADAPGILLVLAPFLALVLWRSPRLHRLLLIFLVLWSALVFLAASETLGAKPPRTPLAVPFVIPVIPD